METKDASEVVKNKLIYMPFQGRNKFGPLNFTLTTLKVEGPIVICNFPDIPHPCPPGLCLFAHRLLLSEPEANGQKKKNPLCSRLPRHSILRRRVALW